MELIRDLERIHPYLDFNCRSFYVIVLNRQLIKNGFSPAFMENLNVCDHFSIDKLSKAVQVGQKNLEQLYWSFQNKNFEEVL